MGYIAFIFGLLVGSFLNVLADRLPHGESVLWGRSHCDHCHKTLVWYELVPVISFLLLGARCRRCKKKLSWQYPIVELSTAISFAYISAALQQSTVSYILALVIFSAFFVIFIADSKYRIIPDSMVIALGIGIALWIIFLTPKDMIINHLASGVGSMLFFYVLWHVTHGRGMGFGDVKLAFPMGVLLGFPGIVFAHYFAFLTGAVVGVILILGGKKTMKSKIAFGPFLIAGTGFSIVFRQALMGLWNTYF